MLKPSLAIAVLVAAAAPAASRAGDVVMHVRDIPLGTRSLSADSRPQHFNMLAAHWRGSGTVRYRVHRLHGTWSPWRTVDADVAPDGGTGGRHDGNLDWTGAADGVWFDTTGMVSQLRSYELWSRVTGAPPRRATSAGTPAIVSRAAWGADEEIVRARPTVSPVLRLAVVHHTAGTNTYSRAQAAAIVRGIEVYHVRGNGWNDIGYNFLVDRFGTVYEGRGGGVDKNVIGAHAEGFNTATTGVALIGNYSAATPPRAQQDALVQVLAWRLDVAHIDPMSRVVYTSGGNYKFRAGKVVVLRAISGHRDTGPSECPGARAYALLGTIQRRVASTGLPKLYAPAVLGVLGGPVRFQARLSSVLPWTVTITDSAGGVTSSGSGLGSFVDWSWSSGSAPQGRYTWTIAAPGIRVATGVLGSGIALPPPASLTLTNLAAAPAVIGPAADGTGDWTTVSFTLGAAARVTARLLDASGTSLATVLDESRAAGPNAFTWAGHLVPDGRYRLVVTARAGTKSVTKAIDLVVDRTVTGFAASPPVLSPNGDGVNDTLTVSFGLAASAPVRLDIEQAGAVVATPFQGDPGIGPHSVVWDGTQGGLRLPDGQYVAALTATDALGDVVSALPLTIDTVAPTLTLLDLRTLRFSLSEPATVTLLVNAKTRIVRSEPKGAFVIGFSGSVAQVTAEAQDAGGNLSPVVSGG